MDFIPFDPFLVPLKGVSAVEASAGTGKTYGIASLYARLLIIEGVEVESIPVVTFTRTAVTELKSRLRARLLELRDALEDGSRQNADPFTNTLIKVLQDKKITKEEGIERIYRALRHFDLAPILTIHGFCRKFLNEAAFMSRIPAALNFIPYYEDVFKTLTDAFFRQHVAPHFSLARYFYSERLTPSYLLQITEKYLSENKSLTVYDAAEEEKQITEYLRLMEKARAAVFAIEDQLGEGIDQLDHIADKWSSEEEGTLIRLFDGRFFKTSTYRRLKKMVQGDKEALFSALTHENDLNKNHWLNACLRLKKPHVGKGLLKALDQSPALRAKREEIIQQLSPLAALEEEIIPYIVNKPKLFALTQRKFIRFVQKELGHYKTLGLDRSYDDQLLEVLSLLQEGGTAVNELLRLWKAKTRFVLVDEFQDTDAVQYEIFHHIFIAQNIPLVFVGDPKQSIYAFRGANLASYLQASRQADHRYSMRTNFRSSAPLITALNSLYQGWDSSFGYQDIAYPPIEAHRLTGELLGSGLKPLTLICVSPEQDPADLLAWKIAALLNTSEQGQLTYQGAPLKAGDLAILVSTHQEGQEVARALKKVGMRSLEKGPCSIFTTIEAEYILALLRFSFKRWVISVNNPPVNHSNETDADLSYLLASVFFSQNGIQIQTIQHDKNTRNGYYDLFERFFICWQQKGIFAAFRRFMQESGAQKRLIANGQERVLANLNQLIILLAKVSLHHTSASESIKWLEQEIYEPKNNEEEHLLQLESDESLIPILTIHAAKGLQYPVVFIPYPEKIGKQHRPLPPSPYQEEKEEKDEGESARELYVALTRAKEALVLLIPEKAGFSKAHIEEDEFASLPVLRKLLISSSRKQKNIIPLWQEWANWADDILDKGSFLLEKDIKKTCYHPQSLSFAREHLKEAPIFQLNWQLSKETSYSQLSKESPKNFYLSEEKDLFHQNQETPLSALYLFPGGVLTGNLWHQLLEKIDFSLSLDKQNEVFSRTYHRYGVLLDQEENTPHIGKLMVENTLRAYVAPSKTLVDLSQGQSSKEFRFMLNLPGSFPWSTLINWMNLHYPAFSFTLPDTQQAEKITQTYLTGFIDYLSYDAQGNLYIVDYKSDLLGKKSHNYRKEILDQVMQDRFYILQALLYALAMYVYFRGLEKNIVTLRIRYLFLRALKKESSEGIWQWDIQKKDIEELYQNIFLEDKT